MVGSERRTFCAIECTDIGQKGTCNFLLAINSNLGPNLHHVRDMATYWLKMGIFPTPLSFNTLAWGEPLSISGWNFHRQDKSPWATCRWRFCDPSLHHFDTVPVCYGQTDNSTVANTGLCIASYAATPELLFQIFVKIVSFLLLQPCNKILRPYTGSMAWLSGFIVSSFTRRGSRSDGALSVLAAVWNCGQQYKAYCCAK